MQVLTTARPPLSPQDIAFFDGFRTGDLVQRLTGDVRAMIQPLQNTLATLLSNLILLFGGVVMCFVTSWRLSMLAFTTVLARLRHVRTVRAVSSARLIAPDCTPSSGAHHSCRLERLPDCT
jgi:ABC-type multidrug transport system fused ATPase/permease subunit